jgi:hypothetical protein
MNPLLALFRTPVPQISEIVQRDAGRYRDRFLHAEPFKHVVIENFFEPSFAERLLADFPVFNAELARTEMGRAGGKAVRTDIGAISPVYQELYAAISSKPFLDLVSRLSGVPDLVLDPKMYGGGTHENLHGQELDPHVDFNYDEAQQLHRRLNLIVYLNKDWQREWGGALEIHSNPRGPSGNRIESYDPLFNRCVMFETNERSWHGFPKIGLPAGKRHLSRKSISIYLYTKDRPAEEIAPVHRTFYVQRPLPEYIAEGRTLTEEDADEIRKLLVRRDEWIHFYQQLELEKNLEIAGKTREIQNLAARARFPLTGYIVQVGATGVYPDGWVSSEAELQIRALAPVLKIVLRGSRLHAFPPARMRVSVDGLAPVESTVRTRTFKVVVPLPKPARKLFCVRISCESDGRKPAPGADDRDLAFFLAELRAYHP